MKCSKCGFENKDKAKFCTKCGSSLTQTNTGTDVSIKSDNSNVISRILFLSLSEIQYRELSFSIILSSFTESPEFFLNSHLNSTWLFST